MPELTHLDPEGRPRMVDVSAKAPTLRRAVAAGFLEVPEAMAWALEGPAAGLKKGDPWSVARIGAVNGAKGAAQIIPLAHPLVLEAVTVDHAWDGARHRAWIRAEVRVTGKTGVEMEAMAAVTGGLLTLYDMLKALGHGMTLGPVRLLLKEGGRRGTVSLPWDDLPPEFRAP
jgi:cyclic pyranopterin phosphate synthase